MANSCDPIDKYGKLLLIHLISCSTVYFIVLQQAASESSPDTDREFEPTAEMLIHDYDDEQTLDEEEAMSNGESVMNELDALQKESEMPMEELLAIYGYGREAEEAPDMTAATDAVMETEANGEEEAAKSSQPTTEGTQMELLENSDQDKSNSEIEGVLQSQTARLLTADLIEASTDEDEEEDEDYDPDNDEDWRKNVQVGNDYQAVVPDDLESYGDVQVSEAGDRLLWDPRTLSDSEVENYLEEVQLHNVLNAQGVNAIPAGAHVRDDEQALYLLLNCEHNLDEALRRHKMQSVPTSDPMSLWSEEECRNFEQGLRTYGKDFFLNQQNKVRTRSVKELVQFYYLWKKTERHDSFASRVRIEKKKYTMHPGITDYMDRFLDEHENLAESQEQLMTPNIRSLLYGDPKKQDGRSPDDLSAALEIVQKVANSSSVDFLLPEKFREDVQAMVLGSLEASSEVKLDPSVCPSEPDRLLKGGPQAPLQQSLPVKGTELTSITSKFLSSDATDALDSESSESDCLPPVSKKLRLAADRTDCGSGEPERSASAEVPVESACLNPARGNVGSASSTGALGTLSVEVLPLPPVGVSGGGGATSSVSTELPSAVSVLDVDSSCDLALTSGGIASFGSSFAMASDPLCVALEPNLEAANDTAAAKPELQRLASLDSIEPSLPALETFSSSIDTLTTVFGVPGNSPESENIENITSVLECFTAEATTSATASTLNLIPSEAGLAIDYEVGKCGNVDAAIVDSHIDAILAKRTVLAPDATDTSVLSEGLGVSAHPGNSSANPTYNEAIHSSPASSAEYPVSVECCDANVKQNRPHLTTPPEAHSCDVFDGHETVVKTSVSHTVSDQGDCAVLKSAADFPDCQKDEVMGMIVTSEASVIESDVCKESTMDVRIVPSSSAQMSAANSEFDCLAGNQLHSEGQATCIAEHGTNRVSI